MRETPFLVVEDFRIVPLSTIVLRRAWAHWTNMKNPFFSQLNTSAFRDRWNLEHTIVMNISMYLYIHGPRTA